MALTLTHAFKEWNIAVQALEQGETILLLRKGGIREKSGHFTVPYRKILLYPTLEHQQPDLLKPEYATQVKPVISGWHPELIRISSFAEITDIFSVKDKSVVDQLLPFHIWNEKFIQERLKWKPSQPLYGLLLRSYKLPQVYQISYQTEYGGCRSWIDLKEPIALEFSTPVLKEQEYTNLSAKIRQVNVSSTGLDKGEKKAADWV